jgi:hypothetical protein
LPLAADEVECQRLDVLAVVSLEDLGGVVVAQSNARGHALVVAAPDGWLVVGWPTSPESDAQAATSDAVNATTMSPRKTARIDRDP